MSIANIDPISTTATTSYEAYLLRQEQLASTTNESSYRKSPTTPPSIVQPATTAPSQQPFSVEARLAKPEKSRNGAIFSALAAQFDITTQLSLNHV